MGNNETTPKTGMVLQVEATDIFSLLIFSDILIFKDDLVWFLNVKVTCVTCL